MFPPLDLPKYSFFFLNFIKLFTFVLLSNKVPGLQCGFQCQFWLLAFILFARTGQRNLQDLWTLGLTSYKSQTLSDACKPIIQSYPPHGGGDGQGLSSQRFFCQNFRLMHNCQYHNLPTTPLCTQGLCNDQKWLYRRFTVP